ncbi:hypothetical protein CsatB_007285 [Cannabis sativa]|uniref:uncharacterized protein LOC115712178 isoform X2 n=1 Tax=Cannabis sativa TaxID=3483 RepID=UPI0029C9D45E|nr:uncharacterized protein LOC115712178 isoform X2 [Cannabis sativa]
MVEQWPKEKNVLEVDIGEDVFGVEHKTYLSKNDILDICNLKWIGSVPMSVWCSIMQRELNKYELNGVYAFMNPASVASTDGLGYNERVALLFQRLSNIQPDRFLVCPWYHDEHWMVILIQTGSQSVAFLDSKNKTIRQDIKRCVQTALERYYLEKRNRRSVAISFTEYRCPEQPDDNQCGYYNMRFIKSFMTENNPTRKLETEFKRNKSSSYTNKEINEIRDEWTKYVMQMIAAGK